jgi:hypothetical protein
MAGQMSGHPQPNNFIGGFIMKAQEMTLTQALRFFEQSSEKLSNARSRLDRANAIIAERILENYRGGSVKLDGYKIYKRTVRSSGFSEEYLWVAKYDDVCRDYLSEGAVDVSGGHYFCGDYNCYVPAAGRDVKVWFAQNIERILEAFAEKYNESANVVDQAAEITEGEAK